MQKKGFLFILTLSLCLFLSVLFITVAVKAYQNAEIVDPTFDAQIQTTRFLGKSVDHLVALPDGKILASGYFNTYNGTSIGSLIRLNADASLDTTFNNDLLEFTGTKLISIMLQPDGKIILQGDFKLTDGISYTNTIIRLNADGTIDSSFNYHYTGDIYEVRVDSSGRILVSGYIHLNENGGVVNKALIRLNNDGTIDSSFNAQPTAINRFTTQNNKILYTYGDLAAQQSRLFRLNEDGTSDSSFPSTLVGNFQILEIKTQPDNKILILSDNRIFRLNENGSVDPDFQITTNFSPGQPRRIFLQDDGRITIAYSSDSPYGTKVIRLLPNGTPDPSFTPYLYPDYGFAGHTVLADGSVIIGDRGFSNRFMRLLPSGAVDSSFNLGESGFQNIITGKIRAISVLPDEKILIGGDFDKVNNISRLKIARLNGNSTLDTSFEITTSGNGNRFTAIADVYHFAVQSDGKIIVSGNFSYIVDGVQKSNLVRINSDGSIDPSFSLSVYIPDLFVVSNQGKNKPLQTADGRILVATTRPSLADRSIIPLMLDANGSKNAAFNPTIFKTETSVIIFDAEIQSNGKIIIAGTYSGGDRNFEYRRGFVARLNNDGSIDSSFRAADLNDKSIFVVKVLQNGQILIVSRSNFQSELLRLNSDGSPDNSFNTGSGAAGTINALAVLPDNKILIGGAFSTYNNQPRQNLALLGADGTLDNSIGSVNREVLCITVDAQGRILIGGEFTSITINSNSSQNFNSPNSEQPISRSYLARLVVSSSEALKKTYFDFDGDGKSDISVFRPNGGVWYLLNSTSGFTGIQFGDSNDKIVPADYDGDGKTDIAVYRSGIWYLMRSTQGFTGISFGAPDDIPQPADFDGDGKAELAVWRPSNGVWYVYNLAANSYIAAQFGETTDKPVTADYDGDGKADYAVYRPSNGTWYLQRSRSGFIGIQFGDTSDKPVSADYDGDGKTDVAVYRPSNGTWYRLNSSNGQFVGMQFGIATDTPTPADYDGDGKADISVFRDGIWYIQQSTNGFTGVQFGVNTDRPVQNAFVR